MWSVWKKSAGVGSNMIDAKFTATESNDLA